MVLLKHREFGPVARAAHVEAGDQPTFRSAHGSRVVDHHHVIGRARQDELVWEEAVRLVDEAPLKLLLEVVERERVELLDERRPLRRLISENRKQNGYVLAESQRVCFGNRGGRRRAVVIALNRAQSVSPDDFRVGGTVGHGMRPEAE